MGIEVNNINPSRQDTIRSKRDEALSGNDVKQSAQDSPTPEAKPKADDASVTLSTAAQTLTRLEEGVKNLPDFDAQRVEELRAAIADGKYEIDNKELARKMLDLG